MEINSNKNKHEDNIRMRIRNRNKNMIEIMIGKGRILITNKIVNLMKNSFNYIKLDHRYFTLLIRRTEY